MKKIIINGGHALVWVFLLFFTKLHSQIIPILSVDNIPATMNRALDVSKPVGAIKGSFDVTSSGASTYQIPIDIAPGTNGMKPEIFIQYSSQSGIGDLGFGWNIGGVSSISRVNNNFFHDANKKEVQLDATDKFALDGQRLICLMGTYGQNQSIYGTEEENFARVTAHGSSSNGPDFFEMNTADNKTITFGGGNANLKAMGSNVTYAWRISKISDIHGNYIEFNYASTSGSNYFESYLSEIKYTGNSITGQMPYNSIKFIYHSNPNIDVTISYLKGYPIHRRLILKSIESYAEGVKFNELNFNYFINEFRPEKSNSFYVLANAREICLKEIVQMRNGQALNSTLIEWGERKDNDLSKSIVNFNVEKKLYKKIITGDFNGDGKTDYLSLYYDDSDMESRDFVADRLYISKENSQFDMVSEDNLAGMKIEVVGGNTLDYNNDGDEDVYLIWRDPGSSHGRGNVFEYNHVTKKLERLSNHLDYSVLNINRLIDFITSSAGDLNGDGNMDIVVFQPDINNSIKIIPKVELKTASNNIYNSAFQSINPTDINSVIWNGDAQAFLTDFNGNGISELTVMAYDNVKKKDYYNSVEIVDGKSNYLNLFPGIHFNPKDDNYYAADYTGDGKTDFLVDAGGSVMLYYVSTGTELKKVNKNIILSDQVSIISGDYTYPGGKCSDIKSYMTVGDYNGDGKMDILVREMKLVDPIQDKYFIDYMVNYSTGDDFAMEWSSVWGYGIQFDPCDKFNRIYTGDFNGDAKTDILFNHLNGEDNIITHFRLGENRLLVNSILDGHNNKIGIQYQTLSHRETSQNVYYKTSAITPKPIMSVQGPMYVVSAVENPNGIGGKAWTSYEYNDLLVHPKGRGMIGFREVVKHFPNGTTLKSSLELDNKYFVPQTIRSEMSSNQYGLISTTTESFMINEKGFNNGRYIRQLMMNASIDHLAKTETVKSYVYHEDITSPANARYLVSKETQTIKDMLNGTVQSTKVIDLKYETYLNFVNARVEVVSEEKSKLGDPLKDTKVQERIYDPKGLILTEKENTNNKSFLLIQDYTYNAYGLTTHKYLDADGKIRHLEFVYDVNNRFPILEYNHNLSSVPNEFEYDVTTGLKTMEKQSSLNPMEYTRTEYDEWNRPIRITEFPYGLVNNTEYVWSAGSGIPFAHCEVRQTKDNAPNEINYLDAQGRVVLKRTESLFGKYTNITYEFDEYGKVIKQSNPYYDNDVPNYSYAKYDLLGRKTEDWNDCGQHTTYTYDDFTNGLYHQNRVVRTTDASGREKKVTNDALGKIVKSEDLGGTIEYKYNCFLEPKEIISNGMSTSFEYDEVGNRIMIAEPNAGKRESKYNAMGLVLTERDSKGNLIEYLDYDDMGRILHKRIYHAALQQQEDILYKYNTFPGMHGFGQIEMAQSSLGTSTIYKYTIHGELESTTETIKGKVFETRNVYDPSNGNLVEIIYPSGYHVYNSYDKTGQIIAVGDGSKVLYQLQEEDAMGRERSVKWAPNSIYGGIESTTSYTACNDQVQQSAVKMTSPIGGFPSYEVFYNIGVTIDPIRGNVIQRADNIKGLSESFTYDELDRLTEIKDFHGKQKMKMDYEENGNIKLKSDWGDYFYGNQPIQPNAVKRISGNCCATRAACLEFDKCFDEQNIVYNAYNKPVSIMEGHYQMNMEYDVQGDRNYYELYQYPNEIFGPSAIVEMDKNTYPDLKSHQSVQFGAGALVKEKYYVGLFENIIDFSKSSNLEYNYVMGANGIFGVNVSDVNAGSSNFYYFQYDFQGSIMALIDEDGNIVNEYSYNAWGKRRNPYNWEEANITYKPIQVNKFTGCWIPGIPPVLDPNQRSDEGPRLTGDVCTPDYGFIIDRGYIGQEHLDHFGLINLNARLYDPSIGRMLSPDNHVSDPNNTQNYNRYSYALNNPMKFVDPDGNHPIAVAAVIIGGIIGAYEGIKIAMSNGYNFSNWQTYLFMLGGGAIGAASGAVGSAVASGGIFSNTMAMVFASYTSSFGMTVMSGGSVTPSLYFGFGSINLSTGKVNTLFSKGNSFLETLGYAVGALANIADLLRGFNPGEAQVQTENRPQGSKDVIGHSQLLETDGTSLIDFGPEVPGDFLKFNKGRNNWIPFASEGRYSQIVQYQDNLTRTGQIVRGLNMNTIRKISARMNNKPGFYNFLLRSCSSKVSRALTAAGLPVIGLHPYLLKLELSLINMGVRPFLSAQYLVNKK